jgi:hypothetical protein
LYKELRYKGRRGENKLRGYFVEEGIIVMSQNTGPPPPGVLPSHFRLALGAGAATPFLHIYRGFAHINLAYQSVSKQCLHICDKLIARVGRTPELLKVRRRCIKEDEVKELSLYSSSKDVEDV